MASRERLLEHLGMFLKAVSSAAEFVHFFNANEWEFESSLDETTLDFLYAIGARLQERADGFLDDDGLRDVLRADLEVFNRKLEEQSAITIHELTGADVNAYLSGEIGFNRLLGNVELAAGALSGRANAGDAEAIAVRDRLEHLARLMTRLARARTDDAAIRRNLARFRDSFNADAPNAGIEPNAIVR